jgi:hypothetical protein
VAVILANCALTVARRAPVSHDASGYPIPGARQAAPPPLPGRMMERPDHSWMLAVDPALWPVREGDLVVEPSTGREWLVVSADLLTNEADPAVDYIRCETEVRVGSSTLPPGVNPEGPT